MLDIEKLKSIFSDRLKEQLKYYNLSIAEFARKSKIPRTSINNWILKKKAIQIDSLYAIANYFNVSIDYLLGREE